MPSPSMFSLVFLPFRFVSSTTLLTLKHFCAVEKMCASWRDYACLSTRSVELIRPFEGKQNRVVRHVFPNVPLMLSAIEKARSGCLPESAYRNSTYQVVVPTLPSPLLGLAWRQGSIVADGERVEGITKFTKNRLYPVRRMRAYGNGVRKLTARRARALGRKIDGELKEFARNGRRGRALLSEESIAVIDHLFERDITLFDSGVLVTNKCLDENRDSKTAVHCQNKLYCGYAGTEIDLLGFDHVQRQFVVVELKITADRIDKLMKRYRAAPCDKSSGFSKSTVGCYLAQTACSASMFRNTYGLPLLPRALLVICEAGGKCCRSFEVAGSASSDDHFRGWIPGF